MRTDIRLIDMHLRDQRALAFLRTHADASGYIQIRHQDVADHLGCHINTARAIVLRLVSAREISMETGRRGGCLYRVNVKAAA